MINYLASFTNTDGASFPDTLGKNATGPSATDGTEYVKLFIDDLWGARQALMDYTGLTPDTVSEAPGTAQVLEAWRRAFGGPGEVVEYHKNDDPTVFGDRILLLNGQGVLRASFPLLDAAVYVGDGDNPTASVYFRADNANGTSRNIAGIYLILPETRGYVARGLDTAASVDPDGASRDLGSIQVDQFQGFDMNIQDMDGVAGGLRNYVLAGTTQDNTGPGVNTDFLANSFLDDGVNGTPRTGTETRMTNYATQRGIRY